MLSCGSAFQFSEATESLEVRSSTQLTLWRQKPPLRLHVCVPTTHTLRTHILPPKPVC